MRQTGGEKSRNPKAPRNTVWNPPLCMMDFEITHRALWQVNWGKIYREFISYNRVFVFSCCSDQRVSKLADKGGETMKILHARVVCPDRWIHFHSAAVKLPVIPRATFSARLKEQQMRCCIGRICQRNWRKSLWFNSSIIEINTQVIKTKRIVY